MRHLFTHSLAPSTIQVYRSAFQRYQDFTVNNNIPTLPVTEFNLMLYVTHLSSSISYKSIKSYLSGLQFYALAHGQPCQIFKMQQLYYILRGIRRMQGSTFTRPSRLPISLAGCHQLLLWIRSTELNTCNRKMLWAAILLPFFGMLRSSEFTSPTTTSYIPGVTLMFHNISFSPDWSFVTVKIKASKTDPYRSGCSIRVGATNNLFCPVAALYHLMQDHPDPSGPLFIYYDHTFLTRSSLAKIIHSCFNNDCRFNTHSLRIGGASTLASAGIPDSAIMILGRWSSNAFQRYLRFSNKDICRTSNIMARTLLVCKKWDTNALCSFT